MELSAFLIYLIGIADDLKASLHFPLFISIIIALLGFTSWILINVYSNDDYLSKNDRIFYKKSAELGKKVGIIALIIWGFLASLSVLVPSSKIIIAMVTVPAIVNNEEVQKLPNNIVKFVNSYLEDNIRKYQKEN